MQKFNGGNPVHICDSCRTIFQKDNHINELCDKCAHIVWCVSNIYEDGSKELSSIHHTEEKALKWIETNKELIAKFNPEQNNKIIKQELDSWVVL